MSVRVRPSAPEYPEPFDRLSDPESLYRKEAGLIVLENYFPILIFFALAIVVGIVPLAAGFVLGPRRPDAQ